VVYIFDRYISGWTIYKIAKDLTASGIPTPSAKRKIPSKRNGEWRECSIAKILKTRPILGYGHTEDRAVKSWQPSQSPP